MESIDYPEANVAVAKDQPQYKTLFVHVGPKPDFLMTACFQLSKEELDEVNRTGGKLFISQVTFGRGYSPIRMSVSNPFLTPVITDKQPADENRIPSEEWDRTHYIDSHTTGVHEEQGPCINCNKSWENHFWSSRQCEL